jgi:pimeloyl-ACP methyl ester carboxylesterase
MRTAEANGIELEYESFGTGEPIILVMGIGCQLIWWRTEFCEALASQGFQVIRFDNRDMGLSTWLDDRLVPPMRVILPKAILGMHIDAPYTLRDMADDVVGLMDHLEVPWAHVVGTSMGGMIAQLVAIHHPDRTASLTSIMSTTGERRYMGRPEALRALLGPIPRGREEVVDRTVDTFRVLSGGTASFDTDEPEIRRLAGVAFDRSFHPRGFVRQMTAILASGNRRRTLPLVKAPTLILHGDRDPLIPVSAGRATAGLIPGARFHLIRNMGHSLPKRLWPELIDWISCHARAANAPPPADRQSA